MIHMKKTKLIYLNKLYNFKKKELEVLKEQLEILESLSSLETLESHHVKINILNLQQEIFQILEEIQRIRIELEIWCYVPEKIPEVYPSPFIHFKIEETKNFIIRSLSFLKDIYTLEDLEAQMYGFLPSLKLATGSFSMSDHLISIKDTTMKKYEKIEGLKERLQQKIQKKYYRIHSYYKFFKILKLQMYFQEAYGLEIKKRLTSLEKNKITQDIYKIYDLKFKLLQRESARLEQQYNLILLVWDIFLELGPLDFCKEVYEIP